MSEAHPAGVDVSALPTFGAPKCQCVKRHNPTPFEDEGHHIIPVGAPFGGDPNGEKVWLCPTAHSSVHAAIRLLLKARQTGGVADVRHISPYARRLARRAIAHLDENPS